MNTNLLNARASLAAYNRDLDAALKEARQLQSEMGSAQMSLNTTAIKCRDMVNTAAQSVRRIERQHKEALKKRHVVKESLDDANERLDLMSINLTHALKERDAHQDKMADQANLVRSLEDDAQSIDSVLNRTAVMR